MLTVQRRIERLEKRRAQSAGNQLLDFEIVFIDGNGVVSETLLVKEGHQQWIESDARERNSANA